MRTIPHQWCVALAGALLVVGCQDNAKKTADQSLDPAQKLERATADPITDQPILAQPKSQPVPATPASPNGAGHGTSAETARPIDETADTATLLTRKTEDYSQDLEKLLEKRQAERDAAARTPAAPASPAPDAPPAAAQATAPQPSAPVSANNSASVAEPEQGATANTPVAVTDASPVAPSPRVQEAPQPAPAPTAAPTASQLERQLLTRLQDDPQNVSAHLDYQLMMFVKEQAVPDLSTLNGITDEEREVLIALLDGLSNFRSRLRTDSRSLMSQRIRPLIEMSDRLRAQADLMISTIQLCTRVNGFGVYDAIEPTRFVGGREHQVIVYCEVINFASQLTDKQRWLTRMTQEVVLYTESGLPVWEDRALEVNDLSRNRRQDFFIVRKLTLPSNLTLGRYILKVSIQDQTASRFAETTIPVDIVAQIAPPAISPDDGNK